MNKNNKIYLETIPKIKYGTNKNKIDWMNSKGYKIKFKYNDIKGYIDIIDYIKGENSKLKVKYNNKYYYIACSTFKKCQLGSMLGVFTKEFRLSIGETIFDNKRDMVIIDREYRKDKNGFNRKYYKYRCLKCGAELWMLENNLLKHKNKCSCCSNQSKIIIKGINDIATTHPKLVKYFVNINDAYNYSYGSKNKILCKCQYCGYEKEMGINTLYRYGFSCPKCSDGISYSEKIMFNLLEQVKQSNQLSNFIYQYSKVNNKWCNNYTYDFYFEKDDNEYIIETHGVQHYKYSGFKQTLEEVQNNDKLKKKLALDNKIKKKNYIIINCMRADLEYIKNNILSSKLNNIFNLNNINWLKVGQNSEKNLVKTVCDYWYIHNEVNSENLITTDLENTFKVERSTIINYLKKGTKLGWCNYDGVKEKYKGVHKLNKNGKAVEILKDDISLGIFPSCMELSRQSEQLFGVKLYNGSISSVCNRKLNNYKGFVFKYILNKE